MLREWCHNTVLTKSNEIVQTLFCCLKYTFLKFLSNFNKSNIQNLIADKVLLKQSIFKNQIQLKSKLINKNAFQ